MKEILLKAVSKLTFANCFCLLIVLLCMGYYYWISYMAFYHPVPNDISEIKISIIGIASSCVGYIVGSTASSKSKDDTIKKALDSTPPTN